jgi:hypothetical protein
VRGKIVFVIRILESLHTCLEKSNNINIFRMLNHPKECAALLARIVEETNLSQNVEILEKGKAKIENVQDILPHQCQNMKGWVKARDR